MQDEPQQPESALGSEAEAPLTRQADTVDKIPSLEEALRQAELTVQEHHDAWLRAKADADNVRKRAQVDIANAHKYAIDNFSDALLPVKDALEAALATENASAESRKSGVVLTLKQLANVFERFNIVEINPLNQNFDPHKHQAITTVESPVEPNTVIQVMQKGYQLNERVIRPAMVAVSKAPSS